MKPQEPPKTTGVRPLSTVLRTLELLDIFADSDKPLRLSEVVAATGLTRATTYQRLLTLVGAGMLELVPDSRYRLSMMPARLANAAMKQAGLDLRAEAMLDELVKQTGETASLAVLEDGRPCIISRVDTNLLLRAEMKIGSYLSLEGSASGRILCAFANSTQMQRIEASGRTLPADEILAAIRHQGYAVSSGYTHTGIVGLAAPVYGADGHCLAALSLVIPAQRYDIARILTPLQECAEKLTSTYSGGRPAHD